MDSSNPLDHVTAAAEASSTGNKELTCKHCEKTFNGGASRAYVHLVYVFTNGRLVDRLRYGQGATLSGGMRRRMRSSRSPLWN
jgi:hypothetical protein